MDYKEKLDVLLDILNEHSEKQIITYYWNKDTNILKVQVDGRIIFRVLGQPENISFKIAYKKLKELMLDLLEGEVRKSISEWKN